MEAYMRSWWQNRDFEYTPDECDKKGWNATHSWSLKGSKYFIYRDRQPGSS